MSSPLISTLCLYIIISNVMLYEQFFETLFNCTNFFVNFLPIQLHFLFNPLTELTPSHYHLIFFQLLCRLIEFFAELHYREIPVEVIRDDLLRLHFSLETFAEVTQAREQRQEGVSEDIEEEEEKYRGHEVNGVDV